jgi:hypothetical protein
MAEILEVSKNILSSIRKLHEEFRENPYEFFYEEDIRARLYDILKNEISYKVKLTKSLYGTDEWHKKEIEINPVKCEYSQVVSDYNKKFGASKFDIVVLKQDTAENFFLWPCAAIIEIKYSTDQQGAKIGGHKLDIEKVSNYRVNDAIKLAIHFDLYKLEDNQINKWYKDKNIKFKKLTDDTLELSSSITYAFYITPNDIFYAEIDLNT